MKFKTLLEQDEKFKKIKEEYESNINKEIARRFNINKFVFKEYENERFNRYSTYFVQMDKHFIKVEVDCYNNLCVLEFSDMFSIEYIKKFREFCNDYLENGDSYSHRAGKDLLIDYLRKYYNDISETLFQHMLLLDDLDGEKYSTFRDWVYSSSCDYFIREKFDIKENI